MNSYHDFADEGFARVLLNYKRQEVNLFGISGDFDNLADYVAIQGRARAQNLVDFIIRSLIISINRWAASNCNSVKDFAIIPAGEEPVVLGLCEDRSIILELFQNLSTSIDESIEQCPIPEAATVSITFGGIIIGKDEFCDQGNPLFLFEEDSGTATGLSNYFRIMENIRTLLSISLDRNKFENLMVNSDTDPIAYRNIASFLLTNHKVEARKKLLSINQNYQKTECKRLMSILGCEYGVISERLKAAIELDSFLCNCDSPEP